MSALPITVGFRVKSGHALVVVLAGSRERPELLESGRVELGDPDVPDSIAPWHAAMELPAGRAARTVARLVEVVKRHSALALHALLGRNRAAGRRIVGAGIVVGSVVDPATIANDHIRAHAEENRLFRVVIEDGMKRARLPARTFVDKSLLADASRELGFPAPRIRSMLAELGRATDGPWRTEQKSAALAAWLALPAAS